MTKYTQVTSDQQTQRFFHKLFYDNVKIEKLMLKFGKIFSVNLVVIKRFLEVFAIFFNQKQ
jgi:hypothetical protein